MGIFYDAGILKVIAVTLAVVMMRSKLHLTSQRIAAAVIPELDYPDVSANSVVMAALEAAIQRI